MHFWVGVENFAKIESAKICVDNYTLLVGPNNSGKTFLMQLVQGLSDKIITLVDEDVIQVLLEKKKEEYSKYAIHANNLVRFVEYLNNKLELQKEQIVRDIFGKEISIGKLYIDIQLEENIRYEIEILDAKCLEKDDIRSSINQDIFLFHDFFNEYKEGSKINVLSKYNQVEQKMETILFGMSITQTEFSILKRVLGTLFNKNSLFLPASRTGLMLLYRDFFVNKTDDAISYQFEEDKFVENKERYGGLTQPIYEFLRFLQTYTEDEDKGKRYKGELDFFEDKLIEGHIHASKQGNFSYTPKHDKNIVPMYLASAMINEVAPMVLALTGRKQYSRLIIDEVEASLHPQKQLELVRFLNRIHNSGVQLIFSTHSDTFVSKLNNLYILSEFVRDRGNKEIIQNFDLEEEDLINTKNLFVYEFIIQDNGKSVVKEIIPNKKMVYQFDLFTESAMNLYDEAMRLGEIH